jgi:hypothetical protein
VRDVDGHDVFVMRDSSDDLLPPGPGPEVHTAGTAGRTRRHP